MNESKPDMIVIDEPHMGIDYAVMEQMIAHKLEPVSVDRYQKYADEHGITRAQAKEILFIGDYGMSPQKFNAEAEKALGASGMRNLKSELQKLLGSNG